MFQVAKFVSDDCFNFSTVERGFLRWAIASDGIDPVEYLAVAERQFLEQAVEEDLTSGPFADFVEDPAVYNAEDALLPHSSLSIP